MKQDNARTAPSGMESSNRTMTRKLVDGNQITKGGVPMRKSEVIRYKSLTHWGLRWQQF